MTAIDVIMLATPNIDYYADHTRPQWQAYCDRYGYDFCCGREKLIDDMHIVWSKVAFAQQRLATSVADWVFLVDADTTINRPDLPMTRLTDKYGPGKDLLVSEDCSRRFGVPIPLSLCGLVQSRALRPPNTGFIVFRRTAFVYDLLQEWLDLGRGPLAGMADVFPREQAVFASGLLRKYRGRIAIIGAEVMRVGLTPWLDRWTMNPTKAFVHHDKRLTNYESR